MTSTHRTTGTAGSDGRPGPWWRSGSLPGAWTALLLGCLTFTPSLLPRPPEFQGILLGVNGAIGYALGVLLAWCWRELADRGPRPASRRGWAVLGVTALVVLVVALVLGERWQRSLRRLVGIEEVAAWQVTLVPLVGAAVFGVLVLGARLVRRVYRGVVRLLRARTSDRAARAIGLLVLVAATVLVLSGWVVDAAVRFADTTYAALDEDTPAGISVPESSLRSGSAESLVAWDSLGREGRAFVGRGPTAERISAFTGSEAQDPIRAYAGIESAEDVEDRAQLAVADLERAGGLERGNLLVVFTTGTGWVEPSAAASFDYLTGGDSAIVAMQYSYLPSWLSFLVDETRAQDAGRALFDAVYERWRDLPAETRPRLFVFGESLGSFGAESAFSGEADMRIRTDGALFSGPPAFNPRYREFVEDRDPGSPEVEPVYRSGRTVRFTTRPSEPVRPESSGWEGSRVLYLQHATDPVTWWEPSLIWNRPDWLEEAPGPGVADSMRWFPVVTYWQISADLAMCFTMPPGQGHNFTGEHVAGWAEVLEPSWLTPAQEAELRSMIRGGR